jgi:hypothetical protein
MGWGTFPIDTWLGISGSALKECYVALGVVTARWNASESMMRLFVAHYAKIPEQFAPLITRHLNNVSMADLLSDCAAIAERGSPDFLEAIKFLCAMYSRCRENRNTIIHSNLVLNLQKTRRGQNPEAAKSKVDRSKNLFVHG